MRVKAHQYTIRNVTPRLHRALKAKAEARGVSINGLAVMALEAEVGLAASSRVYDDMDDLFGTWVRDKAVDRALSEQRKVAPKDWA